MVPSISVRRSSARPMLQGMATASPGPRAHFALISAATVSQMSALRLDTTTLAPWAAICSAIDLPMPLVEPVTTATLPDRSNISGIMSGLLARSDFAGRGRQHAAVDDDGLAGDPASGARRQCGADAGDVLRIADASQRIGAPDRGGALRVGPQDRKGVVEGKGVSGRLNPGGGRT